MCSWLGIQDASRKVQPPSQAPGTWDGNFINTEGGVHRFVSQDRWDKTWQLITELVGMERGGMYGMSRVRIESIIGFMIYVSRTYRYITPYPKVVHLTLYSWRLYMDDDRCCLRGEVLKMAEMEGPW